MKLAIFIPTYNRPSQIEGLLTRELDTLIGIDVDVFIADSSEQDDTEKIVRGKQAKFPNLFYERVSSKLSSNAKVYLYYEKLGGNPNYDYVWLRHDHTFFKPETLAKLPEMLEGSYDVIIVRRRNDVDNDTKYYDAREFFVEQYIAFVLFGAFILRRESLLEKADWNMLRDKYMGNECEDIAIIPFVFEQIAKIHSFSAICRYFEGDQISYTVTFRSYKFAYYYRHICHPAIIKRLTDFYSIAEKTKVSINFLNQNYSVSAYIDKYLTEFRCKFSGNLRLRDYIGAVKVARKYNTKFVFDFSILMFALIPERLLRKIYDAYIARSIRKFKINHSNVYIYGVGIQAMLLVDFLNKHNLFFTGFVVTQIGSQSRRLVDKSVYQLSEMDTDTGNGFIISVGTLLQASIIKQLESLRYGVDYMTVNLPYNLDLDE